MYDVIQSKAHELGSSYCCYDLYFIKCLFLTEENSFIQQIKKIVYIQAILPTVAYISNKSGAIVVQHSSTPPPRQYLSAYKQFMY